STDDQGRYEFKHARPGNLQMRVQAKDFAVLQTKVFLPDQGGGHNFVLEPALNLTVQIVGSDHNPVTSAHVMFSLPGFRGASQNSFAWGAVDAQGRYSWKSTPSGPIEVWVGAEGYESTLVTAQAGEKETVVELKPAKILELHIVDADTAKPIPNAK